MREIIRLVVVLGSICAISATALEIVRGNLESKIEMQNDMFIRGPALERLFQKPAKELLKNKVILNVNDESFPVFYSSVENGDVTNMAIEGEGKGGYGGDIVILLGLDLSNNRILGMEIIQHQETPGVGARVEKPSFLKQWKNLALNEKVALSQDGGKIDAISGATYTSHSVIDGTNRVLNLIRNNKEELMKLIRSKELTK